MFMQIHGIDKLVEKFLDGYGQKWVWPLWS